MAQTMTGNRTVVGLFDSMDQANRAADQLRAEGIDTSQISIIAGNESNRYNDYVSKDRGETKDAASRAGTGAAIGGGLGLVAGLVALAIPGFGPVIAAGPIAAALTGAAAGAATGGLIGGLTAAGVSESDARLYENRLKAGGVLVTVRTSDAQADRVADILDSNGARDVDENDSTRSDVTHTGSTLAGTGTTNRLTSDTGTTRSDVRKNDLRGEKSIPVVEERVEVGKREVSRRGVRIYSDVQERPVDKDIELREEHIHVERRPADRPATEADLQAFREGTIELTETREEPMVRKEARVVEEVIVGKDVNTRREKVHETARHTDVRVEETGGSTTATSNYDTDFRSDYQTRYGKTGRAYDYYAPGYTFGSQYANEARYRDRDWNTVEPELRRDWESRGRGTWEEFKDSVRYGWDKVRGRR